MRKFYKVPQNTRLEINVSDIAIENVEGIFSVSYTPAPEMYLVSYYCPKGRGQVTTVTYNLEDRKIATEEEISERDAISIYLGQALLEFSEKSRHPVANILPGFLEALAHKIKEDEEKKSSFLDEKLIKERRRHKQKISVSPNIKKIVSSRLREAREDRQRQMLNH